MSRTFKDVPNRALKSGYEESHYGCQFDVEFPNSGGRIVTSILHPPVYTDEPEMCEVEYLVSPEGDERVRVWDVSAHEALYLTLIDWYTKVVVTEMAHRLVTPEWVEHQREVAECDINSPGGKCHKWRYQDFYSNEWFNTKSVRATDRDTFLDMVKEYNSTGEVTSVEDEIHWYN